MVHSNNYHLDIEFQIILSIVSGIIFGPFSYGLEYTLIFLLFYEFYVFYITEKNPPYCKLLDRILINVFFIFGWVISRFLFIGETGFERAIDECDNFMSSL